MKTIEMLKTEIKELRQQTAAYIVNNRENNYNDYIKLNNEKEESLLKELKTLEENNIVKFTYDEASLYNLESLKQHLEINDYNEELSLIAEMEAEGKKDYEIYNTINEDGRFSEALDYNYTEDDGHDFKNAGIEDMLFITSLSLTTAEEIADEIICGLNQENFYEDYLIKDFRDFVKEYNNTFRSDNSFIELTYNKTTKTFTAPHFTAVTFSKEDYNLVFSFYAEVIENWSTPEDYNEDNMKADIIKLLNKKGFK